MAAAMRPACSASFAYRRLARRLGVAVREARAVLPRDDAHLRSIKIALFALGGELRPPPNLTLKDQVNTGPSHVGALASLLAALATPSVARTSSSCWDLPAPVTSATAWPRLLCLDLLIPKAAEIGVQALCRPCPLDENQGCAFLSSAEPDDLMKFTDYLDAKRLVENPECVSLNFTDYLDAKHLVENSERDLLKFTEHVDSKRLVENPFQQQVNVEAWMIPVPD